MRIIARRRVDLDETIGVWDRSVTQKDRIDRTENDRVRADAERERCDNRRGKHRRPSQPPQGISNIATGIGPHDIPPCWCKHPNVTVPQEVPGW